MQSDIWANIQLARSHWDDENWPPLRHPLFFHKFQSRCSSLCVLSCASLCSMFCSLNFELYFCWVLPTRDRDYHIGSSLCCCLALTFLFNSSHVVWFLRLLLNRLCSCWAPRIVVWFFICCWTIWICYLTLHIVIQLLQVVVQLFHVVAWLQPMLLF